MMALLCGDFFLIVISKEIIFNECVPFFLTQSIKMAQGLIFFPCLPCWPLLKQQKKDSFLSFFLFFFKLELATMSILGFGNFPNRVGFFVDLFFFCLKFFCVCGEKSGDLWICCTVVNS